MRDSSAPTPIEHKLTDLVRTKRPRRKIRPLEDWRENIVETLLDYLPAEIRERAWADQRDFLERQAKGETGKRNRNKDAKSEFILTHILCSVQGGHPMTGKSSGGRRYYAVSQGANKPGAGDPALSKMVRAERLEFLVLSTVRKTIMAMPNLAKTARAHAERAMKDGANVDERARIEKQLEKLVEKQELVLDNFEKLDKASAQERLDKIDAERRELEQQLQQMDERPPAPDDAEAWAARMLEQLAQFEKIFTDLPRPLVRELLEAVVAKLEVDLNTKHVDLELRLPSWLPSIDAERCLDTQPSCKLQNEATAFFAAPVLKFRFIYLGNDGFDYIGFGVAA